MQWVELLGPHGIGKSTLVKRVRKRPGMTRFRIKNDVVTPLIEGWDLNRPTTWKQLAHWRPFLEVVESLYRKSKDDARPDTKRRRNLCRTALRMSMVQAAPGNEVTPRDILGAEGMRLSFVLKDPDEIRRYFQTMPLSIGVIMLEASFDEIVKRNSSRAPARPDFGALTKQGMRACAIAAEEFAKRRPVLRLDTMRPIEESLESILKFVQETKQ